MPRLNSAGSFLAETLHSLFINAFCLTTLIIFFSSPLQAEKTPPLTIGLVTALTGPVAPNGIAVRNGVELAISENPKLFEKVRLVAEDDQFDPKQSVSAFRKLTSSDRARIVISFGGPALQAIAPIAETQKVLLAAVCFPPDPARGKRYVFRTMNPTRHYSEALVSYLNQVGVKELHVASSQNFFLESVTQETKRALMAGQQMAENFVVNPDERDLGPAAMKAATSPGEYFGLFLLPQHIISFVTKAQSLRVKKVFFGTDFFESVPPEIRKSSLLDGAIFPDNAPLPEFRERYLARYGNDDHLTFAASAYDATKLIGSMVTDTGTTDPEAILPKLHALQSGAGMLGPYTFENTPEDGMYMKYGVVVKRIQHGHGEVVR